MSTPRNYYDPNDQHRHYYGPTENEPVPTLCEYCETDTLEIICDEEGPLVLGCHECGRTDDDRCVEHLTDLDSGLCVECVGRL